MESIEHYGKSNTNCFKGKNILITGATGGIGSLVTQTLLQLGANIIILGRNQSKIMSKFSKYSKSEKFGYELLDFEKPEMIKETVVKVMKRLEGRLDIVIICHGIWKAGGIVTTDSREFDHTLNVNTRSVFSLISLITPFIKLTRGNIVVMSSLESLIPTKDSFLNSLSKVSNKLMII